jgi:arylsulfatase A-like enzyme
MKLWIPGLALLLLVGCGKPLPSRELPAGSSSEPDILLISIDTLRPDHLGLYGYERETSPYLDSMAREGSVFDQAWASAPWTLPSHATMLSGRRPQHHGAIDEALPIASNVALLPEALGALGYRRAGFVTTPFVGARYGFDRGFDWFEELLGHEFTLANAVDADSVAERVLGWAEQLPAGVPAFGFVHLYDAHYPCDPPEPFNTRFNRVARPDELEYENYFHYIENPLSEARLEQEIGQYDEEIAFVDQVLEELCTTWAASRPNTIFVVVSDHGEEFGERGSWGHGHTLTPEQLHVPWIVWGQGIARRRIETRVGLEDLAPTLAALAGTAFGPFDGIDRSGALRTVTADPGDGGATLASTSRRNTLKIRLHAAPLDLIADLRGRQVALYDLVEDPAATRDLVPEHPDLVVDLWARMIQEVGLPWEVANAVPMSTEGVVIAQDGRLHSGEFELETGSTFGLWPLDARLRTVEGTGFWQLLGGALPGPGDPVQYHGETIRVQTLELTDEERERLRALGYVN